MKPEYLELRIKEFEEVKKALSQKRSEIDKELIRLDGKIEALWEWVEAQKQSGEYGGLSGGQAKVLKVPTIGNAEDVAKALANRANAPTGETAEEVALLRRKKQIADAQNAVDVMEGQGPFTTTVSFLPPGTEPDAILYTDEDEIIPESDAP